MTERLKDLWYLYGPGRLHDELLAWPTTDIRRKIIYQDGYRNGGYVACKWKLYLIGGKVMRGKPVSEEN